MSHAMDSFITIARLNAGLITTLGALVILFSWIINNTLKTNYERLKSAIAGVNRDLRIYGVLAELRTNVNSIASEIVQPTLLDRAAAVDYEDSPKLHYEVAQAKFLSILLAAEQVRELNDFCSRELELSNTHSKETVASKELRSVEEDVSSLHKYFSEQRKACEIAEFRVFEADPKNRDKEFEAASEIFNAFTVKTRDEIIPKVRPLYERAVSASNDRHLELYNIEARTTKWATRFGRISIWLYIIGSALVLFGQILDKTNLLK